jgi:Flp pilus assembly protein TadG
MVTRRIIRRLQSSLGGFCRNRSGNTAITFAVVIVPIIGAVGAGVDYSRGNSVKSAMQAALDSAALTMGKEYLSLTSSNATSKATNYFNAVFNRTEAHDIKVTTEFKTGDEAITLVGTGTVDTSFIRVLGIKQLKIDGSSTVVWGTNKALEIALVLDNTGSMASSGKIEALKNATKDFIDAMKKVSRKSGDVKVAVIPFDTHVNIGTGNKDASWIDWSLMTGTGTIISTTGSSWSGANNYGDADDDTRYDDVADAKDNWNGCVIDRQQSNDVTDMTPSGNLATAFPAVNCDLAPLLPLTTDFTAAKDMLGRMKASGKTNLTVGLVWGWHALTPTTPLTEAAPISKTVDKYLVFLTDGLNTQNRWTTKAADIDARTKLVCDNIKKAGIKIYTIRVMEGNQSLLQSCASAAGMYYNVTRASQLKPVFTEIAQSLYQLRISK